MQTNRARHNRFGFTLVELLVVISIIGILMGLLLPAVMSVQSQARQTQCVNHMKNVAFALQNYESSKNCFPGYRNYEMSNDDKGANWVVQILSQLDEGGLQKSWLFEKYNSTTAEENLPSIATLMCPADGRKLSRLSYKINSGLNITLDKESTKKIMRFTGIGLNRFTEKNLADKLKVSLSMIEDGASNTVLLGENGHAALQKLWNYTDSSSEYYSRLVYVADKEDKWVNQKPINRNMSDTGADASYARPTSNHRGVTTIAYCDGHVRSMKDTTNYNIYKFIMCPCDSKAQTAFTNLGIKSNGVSVP